MNFDKSKLHVSRNMDVNLALHLSPISGILFTNGLGTYLGISLFHERVTQCLFNPLPTRVSRKLSGGMLSYYPRQGIVFLFSLYVQLSLGI